MKTVHTDFTEKHLTGNAGLIHVGRFAQKLRLKQILDNTISIKRADNAVYQASDIIMMTIMGCIAGAKHINHMALLRLDNVIRTIFNWSCFPVDTTFSRIFKQFSALHCRELSEAEDKVRKKVWSKKWFSRVTFDMDSSVNGVYGCPEGAEKGYNPTQRGQKSYHPLFCFVAETRECFHNWFRCGSAYSANGSVEFMKECFARLPKRIWRVFVRADSAFFNGDLLDFLESKSSEYLIKVKMKGLETLLSGKKWRKARNNPGFETAEFFYQCAGWKRPRRFVAVRRCISIQTEGFLFPEVKYDYFCYVTNLKLTPWQTHKKYGKRATSENWIEWCKNQMACGSMLTQDFWANSVIFQTCILAYDLQVWMLWLNTENGFKEEPNTIRFWLIRVPARFLAGSRKRVLKLSKNFWGKQRWLEIENNISNLCFS